MTAIPIHSTATEEGPFDPQSTANAIDEPVTKAVGEGLFAWHMSLAEDPDSDPDGDGYPDLIEDSRFPHHAVVDGIPGAANLYACRDIVSGDAIDGIDPAEVADVKAHAQAHLDDAKADGEDDDMMGTAGKLEVLATPARSYRHVAKALFERAWAVQEQYLTFMAEMVRFRATGGLLSSDEITERLAAAAAQNGDRAGAAQAGAIAIIPMYGILSQRQSMMSETSGGTSLAELRSDLHDALNDPSVKAVVFDIDSPGGSVDGVTEFAAELRQARNGSKPIVAQVNTLCASAAYWLASCMSEVVITPSGECGSIGVYAAHEDMSGAEAQAGVKTTLISAGPFKVDGNSFEPLTDTARAAMQEHVDTFYQSFVGDVAKGRGTTIDAVAEGYGQGRTMLAKKALAAGMVDRIDTLESTVSRLAAPQRPAARGAALQPLQPAAAAAPLAAAAAPGMPDRAWNQRMKGRNR